MSVLSLLRRSPRVRYVWVDLEHHVVGGPFDTPEQAGEWGRSRDLQATALMRIDSDGSLVSTSDREFQRAMAAVNDRYAERRAA